MNVSVVGGQLGGMGLQEVDIHCQAQEDSNKMVL